MPGLVIDASTTERGYPLPNELNDANIDAARLLVALEMLDVDVAGLLSALAGKAGLEHSHAIDAVVGLVAALAAKAGLAHNHSLASLLDVDIASAPIGSYLRINGENIVGFDAGTANYHDVELTGNSRAVTRPLGTNTNQIATMAAVKAEIDALKSGAPGIYDTLGEIAVWLQANDTELLAAIAGKLNASVVGAWISANFIGLNSAAAARAALAVREKLAADKNIYQNFGGNDANDGLAIGSAVSTLARAYEIACQYDTNGFDIIINMQAVAAGSFVATKAPLGTGRVIFRGVSSAITTLRGSGASAFTMAVPGRVRLEQVSLATIGAGGYGIASSGPGSVVEVGPGVDFQTCYQGAMIASTGGIIDVQAPYNCHGAQADHMTVTQGGEIRNVGHAHTSTGSDPKAPFRFVLATTGGKIVSFGCTWAGTWTGTRYFVNANALIYVAGSGVSYFKGDVAGSASTGGFYG